MKVKVFKPYQAQSQREHRVWNRHLASLILNGKIEISEIPFNVRVSHTIYYIYALRNARSHYDNQVHQGILNLLAQDILRLPENCQREFEMLYFDYQSPHSSGERGR